MVANSFESMSEAFANDAVNNVVNSGGNAESAMGNDVAATFNLGMGLSKWFANMSGGVRNNVIVFGDSNVQSVPAESYRWPVQLKTDLLAFTGIADGGPGFRHLGLPEWTIPARSEVSPGQFNQMTLGQDPGFTPTESQFTGLNFDIGPNGYAYVLTGQNNIFTWTLASAPAGFTHDRYALYGFDDNFLGQQSEQSVNGGAFTATNFDFSGTTNTLTKQPEVVTAITTTLRVRGSASGFPAYVAGAAFYQGTTGLVVHNLAVGGNQTGQIVGRDAANRLALVNDLQPKLSVIWTGTNEFNNDPDNNGVPSQKTLSKFDEEYRKIVTRCKTYGDVLMVFPHASATTSFFTLQPLPRQQREFERVARKIAYDLDCGYISIHQLWGDFARANNRAFMSDALHINQLGHNVVSKFLTRSIRRVS